MFKTMFAPAERIPKKELNSNYNELAADQMLRLIADAIPDVATILTPERQIIYANKALLDLISGSSPDDYLGDRPGELLNCIHATETIGGCGTTASCRFCGAVNAIIECQRTGKQVQNECRISAIVDGNPVSFDLLVTTTPFPFNSKEYIVFTVKDISDHKRKKALEKMFFHDVLNTAAGLNGILYVLKEAEDKDLIMELTGYAEKASTDLIEDIISQRSLMAAENGELVLNNTNFQINKMMGDVARNLRHHKIAGGKIIAVEPFHGFRNMFSDVHLIKRILTNLVKNALEASFNSDTITLTAIEEGENIEFSVHNPGIIPEAVKQQIFQRSFSTKGVDRGIGLYSIKLLTTRYLKGKVIFTSEESTGTTFTVCLPANMSNNPQ
jgi:nitrogen-specific signal transduction histidine kinase